MNRVSLGFTDIFVRPRNKMEKDSAQGQLYYLMGEKETEAHQGTTHLAITQDDLGPTKNGEILNDRTMEESRFKPELEIDQGSNNPILGQSPIIQNRKSKNAKETRKKSKEGAMSDGEGQDLRRQGKLSKNMQKKVESATFGAFLSGMASEEESEALRQKNDRTSMRGDPWEENEKSRREAKETWEIGEFLGLISVRSEGEMVDRIEFLGKGGIVTETQVKGVEEGCYQ